MNAVAEQVVVSGAGMAGLCTALSLASRARRILILERDPPAPDGGIDAAFDDWDRRGVGQFCHSHAFLARLCSAIKRNHPALLDALRAAGVQEIGFADILPRALKAGYRPEDGDDELVVLTSRRSTLEWVMRQYVEHLPGVEIRSGVLVRELIIDRSEGGGLRVTGVRGDEAGGSAEWRGDLVVDAAGRLSPAAEQLRDAGARITDQAEDCGILYYTRHYRLLSGDAELDGGRGASTGDLGYIKYGLFPGDNGCFSVTLAAPDIETELRRNVLKPEIFDRICALIPALAPWTDPQRSQAVSKVFAMGDLRSQWRAFVREDQRAILGFFAVGDSLARTNPLYGRGCSFAAVEAELLAAVLGQTTDPAARARLYDARVREELTVYFNDMRDQDIAGVRRARQALDPSYSAPLRSIVMKSFVDDGVRIAMRSEIDVLRAAFRDFHMLEPPGRWLRRPSNAAKVIKWWSRGRRRNAHHYSGPTGPGRSEMMAALGIDAAADREGSERVDRPVAQPAALAAK